MCAYFIKSEGLTPSKRDVVDSAAHGTGGPLGWSRPLAGDPASRDFVRLPVPAALRTETTTARTGGGPRGCLNCSKPQPARGMRSSTYHAFS